MGCLCDINREGELCEINGCDCLKCNYKGYYIGQ